MRNLRKITQFILNEEAKKQLNNELDRLIEKGILDIEALDDIFENGQELGWINSTHRVRFETWGTKWKNPGLYFLEILMWEEEFDILRKYIDEDTLVYITRNDYMEKKWKEWKRKERAKNEK